MRCHSVLSLICTSRLKFTSLGRCTLKGRNGKIPSEVIIQKIQKLLSAGILEKETQEIIIYLRLDYEPGSELEPPETRMLLHLL